MRVAIMGAGGQLGAELTRCLSDYERFPLTRAECDICDFRAVHEILSRIHPAIVINAAAFTYVDECEDNAIKAWEVNACAVRNLAATCVELKSVLVHVSTDYVFGGEKCTAYVEEDPPCPLNVYGVSKLAGEYFVRSICPQHFIVRTSGLYGKAGVCDASRNFVETMLHLARTGKRIRVVNDQVVTPTYARDVAGIIQRLMRTDAFGVYHVTNGGECSWYQFAGRIFARVGIAPDLAPITSAEFGAKARRPLYSVLSHGRLNDLGLGELRSWEDALETYLMERLDT